MSVERHIVARSVRLSQKYNAIGDKKVIAKSHRNQWAGVQFIVAISKIWNKAAIIYQIYT